MRTQKLDQHSIRAVEGNSYCTDNIEKLILRLRPSPKPRTTIVCGSHEAAKASLGENVRGFISLSVKRLAEVICNGSLADALYDGTVIEVTLDDEIDRDGLYRLLAFWAIRSTPARIGLVLIAPGLAKFLETVGDREMPFKPPKTWSWLVTLVLKRLSKCWEVVI